jgi:sigma-B regulation protein RsbU (phosphoserine phosphatase)
VRAVQDSTPPHSPDNHALDAEAARLVVANGIYIYDDPSLAIRTKGVLEVQATVLGAFTVQDPDRRWIYIFALEGGWVREEVEFCLKAVRSQLNFQLHIDAMDGDVQQAAIIQRSLVSNSVPLIAGYETAGCSQPADIMGGDFFDFSILDEDFFTVAVGDVSGHGLPAALLVRDVVTGLRMGVEREMRMAEAVQKLNRVIHRSTLSTNFVSLFFAEIESTGNILYVNAGHPPPLLVHGSTVKRLEPTGMVLGAMSDTPFRRASATLAPGTVLLMYSDGAIERQREHEEFGLDRLEQLVIRHQGESATAILDVLHRAITAFGIPSRFEDDLTLVIIKRMSAK